MKRRSTKVDVAQMDMAERNYAKAAALSAGVARLLSDQIENTSWGSEITLSVATELLEQALHARKMGDAQLDGAMERELAKRFRPPRRALPKKKPS